MSVSDYIRTDGFEIALAVVAVVDDGVADDKGDADLAGSIAL